MGLINLSLTAWLVLLPLLAATCANGADTPPALRESCELNLVESNPVNPGSRQQVFRPTMYIGDSILDMINRAQRSIMIAAWKIELTPSEFVDNELGNEFTSPGKKILEALEAASKRGVKIELVLGRNQPEGLRALRPLAKIHYLGYDEALGYDSVMNSNFIITDDENFHLGSSGLLWSTLTLSKSLGITFLKCKSLAKDLNKIFQTYVQLAESSQVIRSRVESPELPQKRLRTLFNLNNPMNITMVNSAFGDTYRMFISSSPASLSAEAGRTSNLDAVLHTINSAKEFIYLSVPEYSENYGYSSSGEYWPIISDALKRAAIERGVRVKLLLDYVRSSNNDRTVWYESLSALEQVGGGISVRLYKVPEIPSLVKYGDHFKGTKRDEYVLTDRGLYLGTSSWTPEYFTRYASTGLAIEMTSARSRNIINKLDNMFHCDYYSHHVVHPTISS